MGHLINDVLHKMGVAHAKKRPRHRCHPAAAGAASAAAGASAAEIVEPESETVRWADQPEQPEGTEYGDHQTVVPALDADINELLDGWGVNAQCRRSLRLLAGRGASGRKEAIDLLWRLNRKTDLRDVNSFMMRCIDNAYHKVLDRD